MLMGEVRSPVDEIWDTFWSGAISNPLELIDQITDLLFLQPAKKRVQAPELSRGYSPNFRPKLKLPDSSLESILKSKI